MYSTGSLIWKAWDLRLFGFWDFLDFGTMQRNFNTDKINNENFC
jgi:hypothetical protein